MDLFVRIHIYFMNVIKDNTECYLNMLLSSMFVLLSTKLKYLSCRDFFLFVCFHVLVFFTMPIYMKF